MRIFVDENIPLITVKELRSKGFDVIDIRGTDEMGIPDELLWKKVQEEKCLLITTDKGFSVYRDELHYGILIIRLKQPTRLKIHQRVMLSKTSNRQKKTENRVTTSSNYNNLLKIYEF